MLHTHLSQGRLMIDTRPRFFKIFFQARNWREKANSEKEKKGGKEEEHVVIGVLAEMRSMALLDRCRGYSL